MKQLTRIFPFIFILAMLFTVVNYLPLIEEEPAHKKVELLKDNNEPESGTDGDGSSSPDDDYINTLIAGYFPVLTDVTIDYINYADPYSCLFRKIHTPPPKV